jgi:hypothetical protein
MMGTVVVFNIFSSVSYILQLPSHHTIICTTYFIQLALLANLMIFFSFQYPETATFLNSTERAQIVYMLKEDSQDLATHYDRKFVWQAMRDYKTYVQIGIYIGYAFTF